MSAARGSRLLVTALALAAAGALAGCGSDSTPSRPGASGPPLLVAYTSNRPPSTTSGQDIYLWDASTGEKATLAPNVNTFYDEFAPGLSADGRWMVFNSTRQLTGTLATMFLYDVQARTLRFLSQPGNAPFFGAQNGALSGDGSRLAFHFQTGGGSFFDLTIGYVDLTANPDTAIAIPSLHLTDAGEFDPALSGDGRIIAFTSNRNGSFDVFLYSVDGDSILPLPGLETIYTETGVSISADARYVAFHSNRPGGAGLFDVYVYDRQTSSLLPMPGANTALAEINPALSPDGRYVVYTTENDGGGDLRLYDLQAQRLLSITGANDPYFADRFPSVAAKP